MSIINYNDSQKEQERMKKREDTVERRQSIYQFVGELLKRPKKINPPTLDILPGPTPLTGPLAALKVIPPSTPDPLDRPSHHHQHGHCDHCTHTRPALYDQGYLVPPPNTPSLPIKRDHISAGAYATNQRELWKIRQLIRDDPNFPRFAPIPRATSIPMAGPSSTPPGGVVWCDQPGKHPDTCCCCITKRSQAGQNADCPIPISNTIPISTPDPNTQTIWCDHPTLHSDTCCCAQTRRDQENSIPWDQLDFSAYYNLLADLIGSKRDTNEAPTDSAYDSTAIDYCDCHGHPGDCCAFSCDASGGSGCGGGSGGSGCTSSSSGCGGGGGGCGGG